MSGPHDPPPAATGWSDATVEPSEVYAVCAEDDPATRAVLAEIHAILPCATTMLAALSVRGDSLRVLAVDDRAGLPITSGLVVAYEQSVLAAAVVHNRWLSASLAQDFPDSTTAACLGVRSFVAAPVRTPAGISGALYALNPIPMARTPGAQRALARLADLFG